MVFFALLQALAFFNEKAQGYKLIQLDVKYTHGPLLQQCANCDLEDMKAVEGIDEETLYSRMDNASDDDEELEEDEDREAYHETHEISSENGTS
ncbi:hypothetical protein ACH5RR_004064 [Cinchona calisaya]|uniref:Uncharacterized protein n=1 Tax=Cinchona calisaya TaxID=153742 RepID=A0ABD3AWV1_9GENT